MILLISDGSVIIFVLSDAIVLPTSCFEGMYFLAMYYESDMWSCTGLGTHF